MPGMGNWPAVCRDVRPACLERWAAVQSMETARPHANYGGMDMALHRLT
jgi:hypothetical protein